MAFNLGAFAGAAAQSGLSTYERLNEQAFRNLQREQLQKDIVEKEALDTAFRESQARVGQQDDYAQAIRTEGFTGTQQARMLSDQGALRDNTPEAQAFEKEVASSATGALRENAVRQGAIPESKAALPDLKPTEFTAKQGMDQFVQSAKGISRKGALEAIQLKGVMREDENLTKFEEYKAELPNTLAKIQGTSISTGMEGVSKLANENGIKNKFVPGKNGVGSRIQLIGPKGDVLETISDLDSATDKLSKAAMQQFYDKSITLLGSPDKVVSAMQGERKIGIEERGVAVKESLAPSEINKNNSVAGFYTSNAAAKDRSFVDKLPEKDKFRLKSLDSSVQTNEKAYAANQTPEGALALGKSKLALNKAMNGYGMVDNIYEGTGIPSPQDAAASILGAKLKPKEVDSFVAKANKEISKEYASELRSALSAQLPPKTVAGTAANTTAAKPTSALNLPRGQAAAASQLQSPRTRAAIETEKRNAAAQQ